MTAPGAVSGSAKRAYWALRAAGAPHQYGLDGMAQPDAFLAGRRFWLVQALVWSAFAVNKCLSTLEFQRTNGLDIDLHTAIVKALLTATLGFAITSAFRLLFMRVATGNERRFFAITVAACLVGSVVFAFTQYELKYILGLTHNNPLLAWRSWFGLAPSRLVVLGAWTSVYVSLTFASEAARHRARTRELETAAATARSEMLRYQVNPHLVFNALTTVSGHVLNKDMEAADRAIQSLSRLLRYSLSDGDATSITLEQEIERVRLYLDVERTRFGDKLKTEFDIPETLRSVRLPPLLLQPLVENAMKHGLGRSTEGGVIQIRAANSGDRTIILVRNVTAPTALGDADDSGEGRVSFGLGLKNVKERLTMFFEGDASLEVVERTDTTFAVELNFPNLAETA